MSHKTTLYSLPPLLYWAVNSLQRVDKLCFSSSYTWMLENHASKSYSSLFQSSNVLLKGRTTLHYLSQILTKFSESNHSQCWMITLWKIVMCLWVKSPHFGKLFLYFLTCLEIRGWTKEIRRNLVSECRSITGNRKSPNQEDTRNSLMITQPIP